MLRRWLKRKFINLLVKHIYKFVTVEQILEQRGKDIYLMGKKLEPKYVNEMRNQAITILDLEVYQLIMREMHAEANRQMFLKSQTFDDMMFGKAMLFCLDVINQKLVKLSQLTKM